MVVTKELALALAAPYAVRHVRPFVRQSIFIVHIRDGGVGDQEASYVPSVYAVCGRRAEGYNDFGVLQKEPAAPNRQFYRQKLQHQTCSRSMTDDDGTNPLLDVIW